MGKAAFSAPLDFLVFAGLGGSTHASLKAALKFPVKQIVDALAQRFNI